MLPIELENQLREEAARQNMSVEDLLLHHLYGNVSVSEQVDKAAAILESISDGFFALDQDWVFIYANQETQKLLRRPRSQILNHSLPEAFPEALELGFLLRFQQAVNSRRAIHFESYYPPLQAWFWIHAYPAPWGLAVYFRNITARKHMENVLKELSDSPPLEDLERDALIADMFQHLQDEIRNTVEENKRHLLNMVEAISDFVFITDTELNIHYSNPAGKRLLGLENQANLFPSLREYITPEELEYLETYGIPAALEDGVWRSDFFLQNAQGKRLPVSLALGANPANGDGQTTLAIIAHDMSTIQDLLTQERTFNALKTGFIEVISHEFRTPIAIIRSSTDILRMYPDRIDPKEHLKRIYDALDRMTMLLDEGLEVIRAEEKDKNSQAETVNVLHASGQIISHQKTQNPNFDIQLNMQLTRSTLFLHSRLLYLSLETLVHNAIHHNPPGGLIEVTLHQREPGTLIIEVKDYGVGIPEAEQPLVFEAFYRGRSRNNEPGLGLGLSILKRALLDKGGQIDFISESNQGTIFTVRIPVE